MFAINKKVGALQKVTVAIKQCFGATRHNMNKSHVIRCLGRGVPQDTQRLHQYRGANPQTLIVPRSSVPQYRKV
jgi:hypothetical protein